MPASPRKGHRTQVTPKLPAEPLSYSTAKITGIKESNLVLAVPGRQKLTERQCERGCQGSQQACVEQPPSTRAVLSPSSESQGPGSSWQTPVSPATAQASLHGLRQEHAL